MQNKRINGYFALVSNEERIKTSRRMNWKPVMTGRMVKKSQRKEAPCSTKVLQAAFKAPLPSRTFSLSKPWRCASRNPARYFHSRAPLRRHICRLNWLFPPISPGSNEPVCDKGEFSGRQFYDVRAARSVTKAGSGPYKNPIYVLIMACHARVGHDKVGSDTQ